MREVWLRWKELRVSSPTSGPGCSSYCITLYHGLIREFGEATGVPVLLNASLNLKGEPIVASPQDAYISFVKS